MDDERARRVGANEAVFRELNEQIERLDQSMSHTSDGTLQLVCECGELECAERIAVSAGEYEAVRADPTHFVIVPGHEKPQFERVVSEQAEWFVVEKLPGPGERVAERTDPRA
jgi:hypothetical protein